MRTFCVKPCHNVVHIVWEETTVVENGWQHRCYRSCVHLFVMEVGEHLKQKWTQNKAHNSRICSMFLIINAFLVQLSTTVCKYEVVPCKISVQQAYLLLYSWAVNILSEQNMDTINDHVSNLTSSTVNGICNEKRLGDFPEFWLKEKHEIRIYFIHLYLFIYFLCITDCPFNHHIRELICAQKTSQKHNNKDWSHLR